MKAIICCEKHGGIGFEGSMPWPNQTEDLQRFKELTLNKTIVMGRGTWEADGMPKPLPDRQNIVVTSKDILLPEEVIRLDEVNYKTLVEDLKVDWCIGGAGLFNSLLDMIDEIHLSHLSKEYECDKHIDLERIKKDFTCEHSELCMTHTYEIWKRNK
ncbi:MAG: hypothetical protein DRI24_23250 [Deltaproteobacteria bacterium]|nr:MAG: hypothetical protein DRI24_23250 [Deltaproteobacteria bacterium]